MTFAARVRGGSALTLVFWSGLLVGCIETGGPGDKGVSYLSGSRAFSASDYQATPAAAGNAGRGTAGSSAAGTRASTPAQGAGGQRAPASAGTGGAATAGRSAQGGMGGAAQPSAPVVPAGPAEGTLTVKLTSVDMRGRYSPRNCGAVWIETKAGEFVKTMERWCGIRAYYLERWTDASGGWGGGRGGFFGSGAAQPTADQMDAVSAATLRMHVAHQSTWDLHNAADELVPDGDYKLVIEVSDGSAKSIEVPFTKGPQVQQLMPPDAVPCTGVSVNFQPAASAP